MISFSITCSTNFAPPLPSPPPPGIPVLPLLLYPFRRSLRFVFSPHTNIDANTPTTTTTTVAATTNLLSNGA